jgi:anti-anti-sigma regulatory factor
MNVITALDDGAAPAPTGTLRSSVVVRWEADVLVVTPRGALDAATVSQITGALRNARSAAIVDLDECIVADPAALDPVALDRCMSAAAELCVTCRRLSCRRLLARVGVTDRLAVFQRVEDALQARILARSGYGEGWRAA